MEPTDFEKWCAGYTGYSAEFIAMHRRTGADGGTEYGFPVIASMYSAYMAGVRSRLPYQTPPKGDEDGMD